MRSGFPCEQSRFQALAEVCFRLRFIFFIMNTFMRRVKRFQTFQTQGQTMHAVK